MAGRPTHAPLTDGVTDGGVPVALTPRRLADPGRRRLLGLVAGAAAAWTVAPWPLRAPQGLAQVPVLDQLAVDPILEAFADTLIPGRKRSPD